MRYNSGLSTDRINPLVGDLVLVYGDLELKVYMKVSERVWNLVNGVPDALVIKLVLPDMTNMGHYLSFWQYVESFENANTRTITKDH